MNNLKTSEKRILAANEYCKKNQNKKAMNELEKIINNKDMKKSKSTNQDKINRSLAYYKLG